MHSSAIDLFLPPHEALKELQRRRRDRALLQRIEAFLEQDIPAYLTQGPVFHLAQNLFTPNFETIRFLRLIQEVSPCTVVTYDSKNLFVTQNSTKRALAKLPICIRMTQKGVAIHEHLRYCNIIDFNSCDGKEFAEMKTTWGEPLIDFHFWLAQEVGLAVTQTQDDAAWIDRHHRGNLFKHYTHFLALHIAHGVLFETYEFDNEEELCFIQNVLRPASTFIKEQFGCAPLISELSPTSCESAHFWLSYPAHVRALVQTRAQRWGVNM